MSNKKYEFTGETKKYGDRTLRRIRRLSDGLVGGWIESESNLSHEGYCFVFDNAMVYDNAHICGSACVYGNACVYDNAYVYENAQVFGNACVYDYACVYGNARVYDDARVSGYAQVYGNAQVYDGAHVSDSMKIQKNLKIDNNTKLLYIGGWMYPITLIINKDKQHVSIGCKCRSVKEWKRGYKGIAEENDVSVEEMKECEDLIHNILKIFTI